MNRYVINVAAVLVVAVVSAGGAEAEYRLSAGDVVRVSVVGVPDLTVETSVDSAGRIIVPFVGAVPAEGKTIMELNEAVRGLLDGQVYRYLANGTEGLITVAPQDVQVSIATYRPIAVYGAVGNPGEIAYRPGMTARHAVAIAGGVRAMPLDDLPAMRSAALLGEINALSLRQEYLGAVALRLSARLDSLNPGTSSSAQAASLGAKIEIPERQRALLARQLAAAENEASRIAGSIVQLDERLAVLYEREKAEAAAATADAEDQERMEHLQKRGIVSNDRVSDVRRAQLLSATRLLQTQDAIARAQFERMELERELDRTRNDRAIELTEALENTELEIAQNEEKISTLKQQRVILSGSDTKAGEEAAIAVLIHRQVGDSGIEARIASLNDRLEPGDVVEVVFQPGEEGALGAYVSESRGSNGRFASPYTRARRSLPMATMPLPATLPKHYQSEP